MNRPSGTVTFLFTDIQGSTRLWEQHPDAMRLALGRHDEILRSSIERNSGYVFRTVGDAFYAAFPTASDGLKAAVEAQETLAAEPWPPDAAIRSRMAITTGTAELRDDDYFGTPLNRASRLLAAGHGAQILVASATRDLLPDRNPLIDMGLHRLKDLPQPERIYLAEYTRMPANLPPLSSMAIQVYNLPQQLTAFVGRDLELEEWSDLIRERSRRLITITGFGGVGKTRVAMRIGEALLFDFPDGVWWCSLEQAITADDALARIAQALSITLQSNATVAEQVFRHLRERNALLVLDNVEQITGGAGFLKQLLAETRQLVCLITSRRTMGLRGETVLELAPMAARESIELFKERASECRPDFAISDENRKDVIELCAQLEGVPLAIELAAARVAGMTPRQILQRLSERFRLLQSRSLEMNERQRALRGAIDWSYALLSDDDKHVFAQLSVFSGGFTLEDAEEVCEAFDVFESVMSLRQQSFFRAESAPGAHEQRFAMLETMREYAAEKLLETGDRGTAAKMRHAKRFLRLTRECLGKLRTPAETQAIDNLERNEKNVRAALDWSAATGDANLEAELALVTGAMQYRRGFLQSAVEIIQNGLEAVRRGGEQQPILTARLLLERAGLHYDFGGPEDCARLGEEALRLLETTDDLPAKARAENLLGQAAMLGKRFSEAVKHYERARDLFQHAGDRIGVAIVLNNYALAERRDQSGSGEENSQRRERAGVHFNEAVAIRRELGDRRGLAETLNNLGVLAFEMGQFTDAWRYYREALTYEREIDNRHGIGIVLANLGEVAGELGQAEAGVCLLAAADTVLNEVGSPFCAAVRQWLDGVVTKAGWSVSTLNGYLDELRELSTEARCERALQAATYLPPPA